LAARAAAKAPPASAMFSIRTCWPNMRVIGSAISRPTVSVGPPAAKGTIILIG
jgi:hypothetical protein